MGKLEIWGQKHDHDQTTDEGGELPNNRRTTDRALTNSTLTSPCRPRCPCRFQDGVSAAAILPPSQVPEAQTQEPVLIGWAHSRDPLAPPYFPAKGFGSVQSLSRVRLCHPTECGSPGFPVHHQLPELAQIHVHRVGDAIQLSHPLWEK